MTGPLAGRHTGSRFEVVDACAKLVDEDGNQYCAIANEVLLDNSSLQTESLLSKHQCLLLSDNGMDDCSRTEHDIFGRPGMQSAKFGKHIVPFYFDGLKCFYEIQSISIKEMSQLPTIVLTGENTYDPAVRICTRQLHLHTSNVDYTRNLFFTSTEVMKKTLDATTQMVNTLEVETRHIMRDHLKTRIPCMKLRRVNDICYRDTFFSSVK